MPYKRLPYHYLITLYISQEKSQLINIHKTKHWRLQIRNRQCLNYFYLIREYKNSLIHNFTIGYSVVSIHSPFHRIARDPPFEPTQLKNHHFHLTFHIYLHHTVRHQNRTCQVIMKTFSRAPDNPCNNSNRRIECTPYLRKRNNRVMRFNLEKMQRQ